MPGRVKKSFSMTNEQRKVYERVNHAAEISRVNALKKLFGEKRVSTVLIELRQKHPNNTHVQLLDRAFEILNNSKN